MSQQSSSPSSAQASRLEADIARLRQLEQRKAGAQALYDAALPRLEALRSQALAQFGTNDPRQLLELRDQRLAANEQKLTTFSSQLAAAEAAMAASDQSSSGGALVGSGA